MNQTKAVVIFGGCVLAAAIGLYVLMKGGDEPAQATTPSKPAERAPGSATPVPPPVAGETPGGDKPVVSSTESPREAPSAEGPKEYDVGGRKVRDHRTGNHAPIDIPPAVHPAEGRRIPSTLTSEIGQRVRAKVAECASQIPAEARGDKPRVEGLVVIAIKNKQVTVTSSTMQLRNVAGAAVDPVKQCIEAGALTVTQPTTEADVDAYDINVSFAL